MDGLPASLYAGVNLNGVPFLYHFLCSVFLPVVGYKVKG